MATRIITTAHAPARGVDNAVGRGLIDPVAALTYDIPVDGAPEVTVQAAELSLPAPPPPPDSAPKWTAAIVIGAVSALVVAVLIVVAATGVRRRQ